MHMLIHFSNACIQKNLPQKPAPTKSGGEGLVGWRDLACVIFYRAASAQNPVAKAQEVPEGE